MSQSITFVTSNTIKFDLAAAALGAAGIDIRQHHMELQEIQSEDGEAIVRHKAEQAFQELQEDIVVSDDTWSIPALNGFPGPYMKDINNWFTSEDFLRLTLPLADRTIILQQHVVFQDESGQHYFTADTRGTLLTEIRGPLHKFPHLNITSYDGEHSVAELLALGQTYAGRTNQTAWHKLCDWLATR